jgi:hypothetical protein
MIFYDWERILRASRGNAFDIVTILRIITYKLTPKNYYDSTFKFYEQKFGGASFLLNPEALLTTGRTYSDKEVAEYAGVASWRNYHTFKRYGDTTLDLMHCPVSENTIKNNRLLDIIDNKIYFMFEEPQENKYGY